jgi:ADP-heptose:LPS heptosyltransferase
MPDTIESIATPSEAFERLSALAFEREDAAAYCEWSRLDENARRAAAADPQVLLSVVTHAASLVGGPELISQEGSDRFVSSVQALISGVAADLREFQAEWFQGLERWVAATVDHLHFDAAAQALQLAFDTGARRFPGLFQALRASEAELLARTGQTAKAAEIALWYAQRLYLLPERRRLPQIYPRLTTVLLLAGRINEYRALLWRGLRESYMRPALRDWFVKKIDKTYRGYLQALLRSGARLDDRAQLLLHLLLKPARRIALLRLLQLDRLSYWIAAAAGYALVRRAATALPLRSPTAAPLNAVLVTRAMGGLGDLLMMTPGLRALKRTHPGAEVHFAVPRQFFALLEGNEDFTCVDIESAALDPARYRAWFALTDCPASRIESRQAPNVRVGRIEAFARALGLPAGAVKGAAARPQYVITPSERLAAERDARAWRRAGRPLVGLQWQSGESYRNYPHNHALLRLLTTRCDVLLFGARHLQDPGIEGARVIARPLRESFALAAQCDALIGPDSSFLHLAAALGKPMVLVAGPVDGLVRAKPYPTVVPIVPDRREFPCAPCWRNESINCYLSERRESVCLRSIAPATVAARVFALLPATPIPPLAIPDGAEAAEAAPRRRPTPNATEESVC